MKIVVNLPRRNPVAKDLRTPKYKIRVEMRKNMYQRKPKHVKVGDAVFV